MFRQRKDSFAPLELTAGMTFASRWPTVRKVRVETTEACGINYPGLQQRPALRHAPVCSSILLAAATVWTAYVYIGVGIDARGWSTMDKLPTELTQRIFSLLEYRVLASAAKVCRTWRHLTDQAELWKQLYERRWGPDKGAKSCLDVSSLQSWKAAYEVQDRWERIGEDMTVVREGNDYFLAQKGLLLRFLGSNHKLDQRVAGGVMSSRENRESGTGTSTSSSSAPGLLDKLIQFVADLDYEHRRVTKRAHTVHDGGVV